MQHWIRFETAGETGFGTLDGGLITVHEGDMFAGPEPTGRTVPLDAVTVLTPTEPSKMIALWNNFHAMAEKQGLSIPEEPLYLIKAANSYLATDGIIVRPPSYAGKVVYEGEIGIVIGKACSAVTEEKAGDYIFGYTCINDVTAIEIITKDTSFPQWTRAKSMDTFGVFGPVVAVGIDPMGLSISTVLNGDERQNYPVSDMIHPPRRIVSSISRELTLYPGDVIACGTSVGIGSMKESRNTVEVTIEGIGTLSNVFEQ